MAELCNLWYVTAKGSLQYEERCCIDSHGHLTFKLSRARMKHQTITAALIPESYAVIWSQYLTEYRINKRVSTDMTCIKHILTCTFKIMAVVKVLICFGINHCFYWNVIWMLCN